MIHCQSEVFMANKKTTAKNNGNKKKTEPVKEIKKTYYKFKQITRFAAVLAAVFGLSFGGSFLRKPDSALSTLAYEVYDIVYEIFSDFDNLEYGIPGKQDSIVKREGYALGYSKKYKQPLWVAYNLTADEAQQKKSSRIDDFRSDWRLWGNSAAPEDYKASGYDRGHLAPAADMRWSSKAMSQSFFMSNMSPQNAALNRGAWQELEEKVRELAKKYKKIHVISGPVFNGDNYKKIGRSRVAVPHGYYKVLYAPEHNEMIGFILPNKDADSDLSKYAVSVYDVEDAVQLEFFMSVSPDTRKKLKNKINESFWNL